ncbi:MAG: hypothetical protein JO040_05030 [Gemmatimonadetes bacterium]|nr:hypothetical protein [Gemmatimonadota bacterium]
MIAALLTLLVLGIVGIVVVGIVLALVGAVFGLAFGALGLAFKALPLLLVGWLVVKLVQRKSGGGSYRQISAADRKWLDS